MFLIKLVTDRYIGGISEQIVGYAITEALAQKYCDEETPKLQYNKTMGNKYYDYEAISNVYEEQDIDSILSNPDDFRF